MSTTDDAPPLNMMFLQMLSGIWLTQLLHVAAKLGVADLLADGPRPVAEIATATDAHEQSLYRVLRALGSVGVLNEVEEGVFGLLPLGELLRSDHPQTLRPLAVMFGEPWHWDSWGALLHSVKTGKSAFSHVNGMENYEYMAQHPEAAKIYDAAMTAVTMQAAPPIADAYDFSDVTRVVDIGGGWGTLLAAILERHPHLEAAVFEMPHVVETAPPYLAERGLTDRIELLAGDIFAGAPAGFDAYLAKSVIHSFDDDDAVKILQRCREAMADDARMLVVEMVLPPGNEPFFGKLFDIEMLTQSDHGRDRTEAEFRDLFARAGLELTRIVPTATPVSVIEGRPA